MLARTLVFTALALVTFVGDLEAREGPPGCLGVLPVGELVRELLPEQQRQEGHSSGGFVNNQRHDRFPVPEGMPPLEGPRYPVHSILEFRFESPIEDPEAFRARVCSAFEGELATTCDLAQRRDLLLTCSFRTESAGRTGTLSVLPDSLEASARILIVVVNEW